MIELHEQNCVICDKPIWLISEGEYDIKSIYRRVLPNSPLALPGGGLPMGPGDEAATKARAGLPIDPMVVEFEPHECKKV